MPRPETTTRSRSNDIAQAWKWSVLFGILAAILMAGMSAFVFVNSKSILRGYQNEEILWMGRSLAEIMAPYVGMSDIPQLEIIAQHAFTETDLHALVVHGDTGVVLVNMVRDDETGQPVSSYKDEFFSHPHGDEFAKYVENDKTAITQPINIGNVSLGYIDMQFTKSGVSALLSKLTYEIFGIALLVVFLWGGLVWMMSRRIYNDLRLEEKAALRRHERRLRFLERSPAANILQDNDWKIISASQGTLDLLGYDIDEIKNRDITDFFTPGSRKAFLAQRKDKDGAQAQTAGTWTVYKKDSTVCHIRINTNDVVLDDGEQVQFISHLIDLTREEAAKTTLRKQAVRDELTGIPNRRGAYAFMEKLHRLSDMCVLIIDLDYFKSVNDGFGHEIGDALLKSIARTLQQNCPAKGFAARLGGEEFLLVMEWQSWDEAAKFAESIRVTIENTTLKHGLADINRTASIGVAKLDIKTPVSEGLRIADLAQLEAKKEGRNRVKLADASFLKAQREQGRFITEREVMEAIENKEIFYYVQPIWNASENKIEGFEALIRWIHKGELLPPAMFLRVFKHVVRKEKYGNLINEQRKALLQSLSHYPTQYVSFNLRIEDVIRRSNASWVDKLKSIKDHPDRKIVVELSEATLTERLDMRLVKEKMKELREEGIYIALDDFGVEASNIDRLTSLPIDILKLDKSMMDHIVESQKSRIAVQSIAQMAQRLEIKVVAEGIETEKQAELLIALGISSQQGFLHSRPVPPSEL